MARDELEAFATTVEDPKLPELFPLLLLIWVVAATFGGGDIACGGGEEAREDVRAIAAPEGASFVVEVCVLPDDIPPASCFTDRVTGGGTTVPLSYGLGSRTICSRPPLRLSSSVGSCLRAWPSLLCSPPSRCFGYW